VDLSRRVLLAKECSRRVRGAGCGPLDHTAGYRSIARGNLANKPSLASSISPKFMAPPLLRFSARRVDAARCPFSNDSVAFTLEAGGCVRLAGVSGCGKSTLATFVAGLSKAGALRAHFGVDAACEWDPAVPPRERCGALFQSTTLIDSLTIAGNVALALSATSASSVASSAATTNCSGGGGGGGGGGRGSLSHHDRLARVKALVEAVGLDFSRDGGKRPTELSGGMARRASLALQLAQRKRVIVLDEPFTVRDAGEGLDADSARREGGIQRGGRPGAYGLVVGGRAGI